MSLINVVNLTFAYDGSYENIFENVSFQMDTDWRLGFVGRNGRGKTTFLNLLMDKYDYSGSISANVKFEYFPYDVSDRNDFTIDVFRALAPDTEDWRIMRELSLMNVDEGVLYRQFGTLSYGEQTKVLLTAMFLKENRFLLIDEPTNHLDMEGRRVLAEYLKKKKGFILVSHDRWVLDECVDHILAINRNSIEVQKGNFSTWQRGRELQDSFERAKNEKIKKETARLADASGRNSGWSDAVERTKKGSRGDKGYIGHKAAKMMKRAKTIQHRQEKLIESKQQLLKNIEMTGELTVSPLDFHADKLLEIKDVSIEYGGREIFSPVSFSVTKSDRIMLYGENGSGKSSILRLICGEKMEYSGQIIKNGQLVISYVPQYTEGLTGGLEDYAGKEHIDLTKFLTILRKLGFSREQFEKPMDQFSAGQRKKVLISASLCKSAHLYIWDEPLNYIDVLSRMQIEKLLVEYRPAMIFVEHDRRFCENVATHGIEIIKK